MDLARDNPLHHVTTVYTSCDVTVSPYIYAVICDWLILLLRAVGQNACILFLGVYDGVLCCSDSHII